MTNVQNQIGTFLKGQNQFRPFLKVFIFEKNLHHRKATKHCNRLAGEVVESPSLDVFKRCVDVVLMDGLVVKLGSARLIIGLNDLRDLFQP